MSLPGWYPDPARTPGRFRYWDGHTWSPVTTTNPADPPPSPPSAPAEPRRRRGPLIGVLAVALVLIIVAVFVVRAVIIGGAGVTEDPLPASTVSGFDDRSPTPTPTPTPPPSDSPTPTPSSASRPPLVACPVGEPDARQTYPADGRIHGGDLSFPAQPDWDLSRLSTGLSWAYDVNGQELRIQPDWFAMFAVGALSVVDGFEHPEQAAEAVMQCTATSNFYEGFTGRKDLHAKAMTVSGRPAWSVRAEIYVDTDRTTLPGDVVDVVVVDLGGPESLAMFWGAVPIGDEDLIAQLDQVIGELRAG